MSTQAQQGRLRQVLQALAQEPGNQRCADCHTSAPRWANVHFGIFLCKDCAAAHRHLGPPLSQVRSIAYDLWSSAHVQRMRAVGNEKSNAHFVPALQLFPPPVESEKSSYEWIQYVRDKYVRMAFRTQGLEHLSARQRTHPSPEPVVPVPDAAPSLPAPAEKSIEPGPTAQEPARVPEPIQAPVLAPAPPFWIPPPARVSHVDGSTLYPSAAILARKTRAERAQVDQAAQP